MFCKCNIHVIHQDIWLGSKPFLYCHYSSHLKPPWYCKHYVDLFNVESVIQDHNKQKIPVQVIVPAVSSLLQCRATFTMYNNGLTGSAVLHCSSVGSCASLIVHISLSYFMLWSNWVQSSTHYDIMWKVLCLPDLTLFILLLSAFDQFYDKMAFICLPNDVLVRCIRCICSQLMLKSSWLILLILHLTDLLLWPIQ